MPSQPCRVGRLRERDPRSDAEDDRRRGALADLDPVAERSLRLHDDGRDAARLALERPDRCPRRAVLRRREDGRGEAAGDPREPHRRAVYRRRRGWVEAEDADGDPRRAKAEARAQQGGRHLGRTAGRLHRERAQASGGSRDPGGVEDARVEAELRLERACAEDDRPPAVVRRVLVPGIGLRDEVGHVRPEDVERAGRLPSRARGVVRRRHASVVGDDAVRRPAHGLVRARLLCLDPFVDLASLIRVQVERLPLDEVRERVRARRDSLCLQRLERPRMRHLVGDDALEVELERDGVDRAQELPLGSDLDPAPVLTSVERERRVLSRPHDDGRYRLDGPFRGDELEVRAEDERPRRNLVHDAGAVEHGERHRRRHRDGLPALAEQDADVASRRASQLGARVVVREDLVVGVARIRHPVRPVLAHADPVPVASPGDDEERLPRRRLRPPAGAETWPQKRPRRG